MPDIPQEEAEIRATKGDLLYNEYLLRLSDIMKPGGRTIKNALENAMVTDADYITEEDVAQMKQAANANTKVVGAP